MNLQSMIEEKATGFLASIQAIGVPQAQSAGLNIASLIELNH